MHRIRRAAVIVGVVAVLAAACGGGSSGGGGDQGGEALPDCPVSALDSATSPVDVVVWHTQQAKPLDTLQALVDKYNASQSKVRVRLESQGTAYEELQRKFTSAVPSKQLPALIMVDDTFTQSMAASGVVLPAQSCVNADNYDMSGFLNTAVSYYTINDVLWPASANLGSALLFYNRGQFSQAGLDPNKPPATLAEVRDDAEKIKAAGVANTPFVHEFSSWKTEFWLTGDQSSVVNNDNGRGSGTTDAATLSGNDKATQLFTWFQGMQADGLMEAIPNVPGQINQYLALSNKSASMLVESSSAATSIEAFLGGDTSVAGNASGLDNVNVSGLDISAGIFPGLNEVGKTQMGGAAWYMMNTVPPEVQAGAWDFMKYMNTPEAQAQMLIGGSYIPYRTAANDLPEVQAFYTQGLSGRWLKIANDQMQNIDPSFPGPLIGPYYEFREAIRKAQDALMFNGKSPEASLDQAQQEVDAAIQRYNDTTF